MKSRSRYGRARKFLLFWCLFIGLGAVLGASGMLIDPSGKAMGMDAMLPFFEKLPFSETLFRNFVFSGIALLCVNGLPNLAAAALLIAKRRSGIVLGGVLGLTLMAWICIQFYMFPFNFMSTAYFIFGIAQAATGFTADTFFRQERFDANAGSRSRIGTDGSRLVFYFSRLGYTKKAALDEADRTGAEVYEIKPTEPTAGTSGFWWCGRFGMLRRDMPIQKPDLDLSAYAHVTICSPIWVFHISAPVRAFCRGAHGQIREADCIITHFQPWRCAKAVREADALLGVSSAVVREFRSCRGRLKPFTNK